MHLPTLRRLIAAAGPQEPEDRKDVLQEVLIRLHHALGSFRFEASFSTWAFRIARNITLDMERSRKRAALREHKASREEAHDSREAPDPESLTMEALRESELKALFYHLSETDRQLLLLREREKLSMDEIASILQIPVGTAKSRLSRARRRAKRLYKDSAL